MRRAPISSTAGTCLRPRHSTCLRQKPGSTALGQHLQLPAVPNNLLLSVEEAQDSQAVNPGGPSSDDGTVQRRSRSPAREAARRKQATQTIDEGETRDLGEVCVAFWDEDGWYTNPPPVRAALLESDPGLNQSLISSGTSVAQIFNQDLWERHRSSGRYWFYMRRMVHSTILRRIIRPCLAFSSVAVLVGAWNSLLPATWPKLGMSLVPHTLLGAALSLLLVFRTNSSYARFAEGRVLWGSLLRYARDWIRLVTNYMHGETRGRAVRYVQVLAFVLKSRLRAGRMRANPADPTAFRDDPTAVVHELLSKDEAEVVMAQSNKPFYMICRMTELLRDAACCGNIPHHVLHTMEHALSEMLAVVGGCDRILGTPIPLSYTRHTARSLVMWLATLPLALWPVTGWLCVPSLFLIAFIFLGIDEIGVEIEEPFCLLPLLPMTRAIVEDANTAMAMAAAA